MPRRTEVPRHIEVPRRTKIPSTTLFALIVLLSPQTYLATAVRYIVDTILPINTTTSRWPSAAASARSLWNTNVLGFRADPTSHQQQQDIVGSLGGLFVGHALIYRPNSGRKLATNLAVALLQVLAADALVRVASLLCVKLAGNYLSVLWCSEWIVRLLLLLRLALRLATWGLVFSCSEHFGVVYTKLRLVSRWLRTTRRRFVGRWWVGAKPESTYKRF